MKQKINLLFYAVALLASGQVLPGAPKLLGAKASATFLPPQLKTIFMQDNVKQLQSFVMDNNTFNWKESYPSLLWTQQKVTPIIAASYLGAYNCLKYLLDNNIGGIKTSINRESQRIGNIGGYTALDYVESFPKNRNPKANPESQTQENFNKVKALLLSYGAGKSMPKAPKAKALAIPVSLSKRDPSVSPVGIKALGLDSQVLKTLHQDLKTDNLASFQRNCVKITINNHMPTALRSALNSNAHNIVNYIIENGLFSLERDPEVVTWTALWNTARFEQLKPYFTPSVLNQALTALNTGAFAKMKPEAIYNARDLLIRAGAVSQTV